MDKQKRMRQPIATRDYAMIDSCRLLDLIDPINDTYTSGKSLGACVLVKWVVAGEGEEEDKVYMGNAFATGSMPEDHWCMLGAVVTPACDNTQPDTDPEPDPAGGIVNPKFEDGLTGWIVEGDTATVTASSKGATIESPRYSFVSLSQRHQEKFQAGATVSFDVDHTKGESRFRWTTGSSTNSAVGTTHTTIKTSGRITVTLPEGAESVVNGFTISPKSKLEDVVVTLNNFVGTGILPPTA